jgi:hypothetical protein
LLRSRNLSKNNGGLRADADQNFGWLLKFSCAAFAFPVAISCANGMPRSNCAINRCPWVLQWRVSMTSSVAVKVPKKTTRSQRVRAEIEDGCHNTSKEVSNQKRTGNEIWCSKFKEDKAKS